MARDPRERWEEAAATRHAKWQEAESKAEQLLEAARERDQLEGTRLGIALGKPVTGNQQDNPEEEGEAS